MPCLSVGVLDFRLAENELTRCVIPKRPSEFDQGRVDVGDGSESSDAANLGRLALNIYHEARGESASGKLAVGHVVMNRVADRRIPATVCAVIRQGGEQVRHRCQFSWWCDGRSDAILDTGAMSKALSIAREVLSGDHDDPTDGAMWYHATRVSPDWRKDFAEGPTIGNHIFYRLQ